MFGSILLYAGSFFIFAWGVAHLFPTKKVVHGFGDISADNKRIVTMEWIIEGATLIFIGLLVAVVTLVCRDNPVSRMVYWMTFVFLNILSLISLLTGFKVSFFAFKLCPVIFTGSSLLILVGNIAG